MYRIPHYDECRTEVLHALIDANPFAALIVSVESEIIVNHVPVLLRTRSTGDSLLVGHLAKANPVWRQTGESALALLIFQGSNHYISPRWYKAGQGDEKAVPTWDYSVVHARGVIEWIEDRAWLRGLLGDMAKTFEAGEKPWLISEMPTDHRDSMLDHIVGFQVSVRALQGKFKLHQGSTPADRASVIEALQRVGTDSAISMAEAIANASR